MVSNVLFDELAGALRTDGARLTVELPDGTKSQVTQSALLALLADRLAGQGNAGSSNAPRTHGRELAGRALTSWFGYAYDGLYDRRIADKGYRPWSFDGLGHKNFQGGKADVLDMIDQIVALAAPASPGALLAAMREALEPLREIADAYDARENDAFEIFLDCDQRPIRNLTLGQCRKARDAIRSSFSVAISANTEAIVEAAELLERSDSYLATIGNKGDCGPHHLVSDLAATLRAVIATAKAATDTHTRRAICATPPEDLFELADQIEKARERYLGAFGTPEEATAKSALSDLFWNDKGTFPSALRLAALSSTLIRDVDGACEMRDRIVGLVKSLPAPAKMADQAGWNAFRTSLLNAIAKDGFTNLLASGDRLLEDEALHRYPQENGTHRRAFIEGAHWSAARTPLPDRKTLVTAIERGLASDDLEPSSEATLKLYRDDAELLASALLASALPLLVAARRWRHQKRGSSYAEIGRATAQSAIPIREGDTVVVYVADVDGSINVRKDTEFEDGRFEQLDLARPRDTDETAK